MVRALLHLDKAKPFRSAGVAIRNEPNCFDWTRLPEQFLQFSFRGLKRQISNIEFLFHVITFLSERNFGACEKGLEKGLIEQETGDPSRF